MLLPRRRACPCFFRHGHFAYSCHMGHLTSLPLDAALASIHRRHAAAPAPSPRASPHQVYSQFQEQQLMVKLHDVFVVHHRHPRGYNDTLFRRGLLPALNKELREGAEVIAAYGKNASGGFEYKFVPEHITCC